jgi:hypothetical protein
MKLQDLKKGDKIRISYGGEIVRVKVIENFPKHKTIYLRIDFMTKILREYSDHNFRLFFDPE